ncbi:MAG: peptidoglycan-binding protein [Syntrophomonadaceae bacterium]
MNFASRLLYYRKPPLIGPDVSYLQKLLAAAGFFSGTADGVFNLETGEALCRFQRQSGLKDDGLTGPETWLRLHRYHESASPSSLLPELAPEQPAITVDVSRRRLYFVLGEKKKTYPVAVGKPSTPTPIGNWTIIEKVVDPGGPFGARWMRLSVPWGGYGIHGTNNPRSIGKAVSHGCIRMYNKDIIEIYPLTPLGTSVNIVGKVEIWGILTLGSRSKMVRQTQKQLLILGCQPGPLDGYFGLKTRSAIRRFQREHNLPLSGTTDYKTLTALQEAYDMKTGSIIP